MQSSESWWRLKGEKLARSQLFTSIKALCIAVWDDAKLGNTIESPNTDSLKLLNELNEIISACISDIYHPGNRKQALEIVQQLRANYEKKV